MSAVGIDGLGRSFGSHAVLRGVDLAVEDGEIMAILGSSGCGKTTLLRIVAGFLEPDEGTVSFGERVVAGPRRSVPAQHREVGYVPQEGALFPHLDVRANILFGLPRRERTDARLAEMLQLAELPEEIATSFPHELSGGQQQRVALARALAPRPRVVLLDEPFSSLDASLRASAGRTVVRVLRAAGTTALLVTHDQGEALSLADRVAVMRGGVMVQVDTPTALYRRPTDLAVAGFVGGATVLPGALRDGRVDCALGRLVPDVHDVADGDVRVLVRPEQVVLGAAGATRETDRAMDRSMDREMDGVDPVHVHADVVEVDFFGPYALVRLVLGDGSGLLARVVAAAVPRVGDRVSVHIADTVGVYAP